MEDTTHSLSRSVKHFFSGTMLSRITGMLRDIAMAFAFGTQETLAAFLVAFRLAHLLRRLLGEGALQTAFIPYFEKIRKENPINGGRFFIDLYVSLSMLLIILIGLGMAGCFLLLNYGNLSPGNQEITYLSLLMLPSLFFICLFGLNASLLQCEKNYFIPSVAPVAFNLVWIIGVLCLSSLSAHQAMPWLSGFIIIACLGQWMMTVPATLRALRSQGIHKLSQTITVGSKEIKGLCKPLFLGIIGVAASQINNALDVIFARYASAEGPAYLWYAIRIQQLPLALFGIAISGALLPPLSRAIKSNDLSKYRHLLEFALRRSMALMLPITAGLFVLGTVVVQLMYGYGDFNQISIVGTVHCVWAYGAGLIPMTFVLILAPAFYAQENYRIPTIASVLSMAVNILLNTIFVMGIGWGAASVAIATSISAWINFWFLARALKSHLGPYVQATFWRSTFKIGIASAAAMLGVLALDLVGYNTIKTQSSFTNHFYSFLMESLMFSSIFFVTVWKLGAEDVLDLIPFLKKRRENVT